MNNSNNSDTLNETSRPEAAFVLLALQATFWAAAGISALPFVLGGEVHMLALGFASIAFGGATAWMAIGVVNRRRWARRATLIIEWLTLIASLVMLVIPLGANRGPVALLVNLALPLAVILLLSGRRMKARFGITAPASR
jgi:hypothetical protein